MRHACKVVRIIRYTNVINACIVAYAIILVSKHNYSYINIPRHVISVDNRHGYGHYLFDRTCDRSFLLQTDKHMDSANWSYNILASVFTKYFFFLTFIILKSMRTYEMFFLTYISSLASVAVRHSHRIFTLNLNIFIIYMNINIQYCKFRVSQMLPKR